MYIVYVGFMNHFRCDTMAEAICRLECSRYQSAEIFKQKDDGSLEKVYDYHK